MAAEPSTDRAAAPNVTVVERRGGGFGAAMLALAIVVIIAIVGVFMLNQSRNDDVRTTAVTDAARTVGEASSDAAANVSSAADRAADSVAR